MLAPLIILAAAQLVMVLDKSVMNARLADRGRSRHDRHGCAGRDAGYADAQLETLKKAMLVVHPPLLSSVFTRRPPGNPTMEGREATLRD